MTSLKFMTDNPATVAAPAGEESRLSLGKLILGDAENWNRNVSEMINY